MHPNPYISWILHMSFNEPQVRARPLSETNPELSKYMEAVAGPSAARGTIASLARRGRGELDADSMGYDEVCTLCCRA